MGSDLLHSVAESGFEGICLLICLFYLWRERGNLLYNLFVSLEFSLKADAKIFCVRSSSHCACRIHFYIVLESAMR